MGFAAIAAGYPVFVGNCALAADDWPNPSPTGETDWMDDTPAAVAPTTPEIRYETDGHVAVLTFNRPDRMNTISGPMLA